MKKTKEKFSLIPRFSNLFEDFEKNLNGGKQSPIHSTRKKAFDFFSKLDFPSQKNEAYKYTSLKKSFGKDFQNININTNVKTSHSVNSGFTDIEANHLFFYNGVLSIEKSTIPELNHGLSIIPLLDASSEYSKLFQSHFNKYCDYENDAATALNTAFTNGGSFIHVSEEKALKLPIILHYINDVQSPHSVAVLPRNLIILEKASKSIIIEHHHTNGGQKSLISSVTEIFLANKATSTHYNLQTDLDHSHIINNTSVYQSKDSQFTSFVFSTSGSLVRNNLSIKIDGEQCLANMYGLYILNGKRHLDNHTSVDHIRPHSNSNELYKGVIDGDAKGIFNGKVYVRQEAQKTNAFQSNKNMLMSDNASINSKPQLEIWADDVKCSHGATTGQIDNEQLFYLRSRGIDKEEAKAILVKAFATDILDKIDIGFIKDYLEDKIEKELTKK